MTPAALGASEQRLRASKAELEAIDDAALSARERLERGVVVFAIRADLFDLERRSAFRDPQLYVGPLALTAYISRPYAPVAERARAVAGVARAARAFLAQADANLARDLPRTWIESAQKQVTGMREFVANEVEPALPGLAPAQRAELHAALAEMGAALATFSAALDARLPSANDDFALGEATFLRMLEETQGVHTTIAELQRVAQADLARNLAAIDAAAKQIDATRSAAEVIASVVADKPAVDQVIAEAQTQATRARAFVSEHELATIPAANVAEVRETPSYMRYNIAFLDGSGPFEKQRMPSFYYVTPPDPTWPPEKQRAYVPDRWSLLSITVHELWPGHFLQSLHMKQTHSRVLRTFRNYATSEGWAHYAEELMQQEGFTPDPRFAVGQLLMALMRDVRFVCAVNGQQVIKQRSVFLGLQMGFHKLAILRIQLVIEYVFFHAWIAKVYIAGMRGIELHGEVAFAKAHALIGRQGVEEVGFVGITGHTAITEAG